MVDTGFNDFLTLPADLAAELGMVYRNRGQMILADGSEVAFDVYGSPCSGTMSCGKSMPMPPTQPPS